MSGSDRAAELRALADRYDEMDALETAAAEAKQAYRDNPTEETKAAHHAASAALNGARSEIRSAPVLPSSGEPGSATVRVQPVGKKVT